jgi:hypothetical protein
MRDRGAPQRDNTPLIGGGVVSRFGRGERWDENGTGYGTVARLMETRSSLLQATFSPDLHSLNGTTTGQETGHAKGTARNTKRDTKRDNFSEDPV